MRQMFIPTIGFEFVLAESWTFALHREHRNSDLFEELNLKTERDLVWDEKFEAVLGWRNYQKSTPEEYAAASKEWQSVRDILRDDVTVTFPAETTLKVDRIYIRKGKEDFDSITFRVTFPGQTVKRPKSFRFWAKLPDVNKIIFRD